MLVSTIVTPMLPAAPPAPGPIAPDRSEVAHCPSIGVAVLVPVGRGVAVEVELGDDESDAEGEGVVGPEVGDEQAVNARAIAAAAIRTDARTGRGTVIPPSHHPPKVNE
ncbi:hypothetical protein GCM10009617_04690 [Leifsonia poae]|uniref:Uncharacterized protein n=1 Tax=Leifsonia poae TaxID=110933 RepID=A0A9W6LYJ4_9MICO|nr:hypothetical protein GCM10017584_04690 [Leifsonia poae]